MSHQSRMSNKTGAPAVPLIPGMMSTHHQEQSRGNFRRAQILQQMAQGKVTETPPSIVTTKEDAISLASVPSKPTKKSQISSKYRQDPTQPSWITNDRQVLRFFAYFKEDVDERGVETERIRRVVLCYYLSDHSISISEPKTLNSGIVQGEFMKRMAVKKPQDGSLFSPNDFRIGQQVKLVGRAFYLVDCDAATRAFYEEAPKQEPQPSSRPYPDQQSSSLDEIEAIKRKLKAKASQAVESKAERVRKFHENSQKVLRFYVSWQDPHPLYPETRKYILHYYLCDDTVEVIEPKQERSGRGHFPVLLSRRKMKNEAAKDDSKYLTDRDLRCGDHIQLFARRFLLEDCDEFTREYYLEYHGITQESFETPTPQTKAIAAKWKLFQSSASSNQANISHGSRFRKAVTQVQAANDALDKKTLRFRAKFYNLPPNDLNAKRSFVLTYYLEDDTLAVFEPPVKNSGVVGGRFLDRGRFRKSVDTTTGGTKAREAEKEKSCYRASDFYVGAIVSFEFSPHQKLELVEADKQTLEYCECHPEEFVYSDPERVLQQLTLSMVKKKNQRQQRSLRGECRHLDAKTTRLLRPDQLKTLLMRCGGGDLNAQQVITLARKFAVFQNDEQLFSYDDFCDAMVSRVHMLLSPNNQQETAGDWKQRICVEIPNLRKLLRAADPHLTGSVPSEALAKVTQNLLQRVFAEDHDRIDYNGLCDVIFTMPSTEEQEQEVNDMASMHSFEFGDDHDVGDFAAPPPTAKATAAWQSPRRPMTTAIPPLTLPTPQSISDRSVHQSDPRVMQLLHRVFGSRKYQLRKALRVKDVHKTGILREEEFMDAILSLAPSLSDDDTYLLADVYFPTNNSTVEYGKLLEQAFRT